MLQSRLSLCIFVEISEENAKNPEFSEGKYWIIGARKRFSNPEVSEENKTDPEISERKILAKIFWQNATPPEGGKKLWKKWVGKNVKNDGQNIYSWKNRKSRHPANL